jgi:hypothetical protein
MFMRIPVLITDIKPSLTNTDRDYAISLGAGGESRGGCDNEIILEEVMPWSGN